MGMNIVIFRIIAYLGVLLRFYFEKPDSAPDGIISFRYYFMTVIPPIYG